MPTNAFLTKLIIITAPFVKKNNNNKKPEKLIHLFWSCTKMAPFWKSIIARLKLCQIIPDSYSADITVSLRLRPDSSKLQHTINYCFLIARHYIWLCKTKGSIPLLNFYSYNRLLHCSKRCLICNTNYHKVLDIPMHSTCRLCTVVWIWGNIYWLDFLVNSIFGLPSICSKCRTKSCTSWRTADRHFVHFLVSWIWALSVC